ncbi:MAG: MBOAT family protein [Cytophagaceae bacterium]|nr:MBOAT family protein [Cytophagaceae bacterium]
MCAASEKSTKKIYLSISLITNVGLLFYFKYTNFFIENLNSALGTEIPLLNVVLPLGISFYTFETITYLVDVYKGVYPPQHSLKNYLLYIFYFPKMIAGPIVRYNEIADQITDRKESNDLLLNGFYRFCIGLAKKVLIANQLAYYGVDKLFYVNPSDLDTASAWIAMLGYTLQIYMDFSAYSDMAIGLGKMMGFRLPENFDAPYTSSSITEFWKRWHITLGTWMKNYLYIPLGGNRVGKSRMYVNLCLIFLISALWHKASWAFVLWGSFYGILLVAEQLFFLSILNKLPKFLSLLITFFLVNISTVLFRMDDVKRTFAFYKALFSYNQGTNIEIRPEFWLPLSMAILFSFIPLSSWGKKLQSYFYEDRNSLKRHLLLTGISLLLFVLALSFNTRVAFSPFIYFRF